MKDHLVKLKHVLNQERITEEMVLLIKHQPFQQKKKKTQQTKTPQPSPYYFFLFKGWVKYCFS